jgi:hypothetical protein
MSRTAERRTSSARWLVASAAALFVAGAAGCHGRRERPQEGGAHTPQAQENRKQAEASAADAVKAAADHQVALHHELRKKGFIESIPGIGPVVSVSAKSTAAPPAPQPPAPPRVAATPAPSRAEPPTRPTALGARNPVVIRERVVSDIPYPTEAEAEERVLKDAQDRIEKRLSELDPPVLHRPALSVVKNEYVRRDSRVVRPPTEEEKAAIEKAGYAADRVYVEYTVELTADQVRELRTRDRVADGMRGLGVITAVALAGFLFLRLDEWTKGYLTSWLALGAAALGGGVVAALVFV